MGLDSRIDGQVVTNIETGTMRMASTLEVQMWERIQELETALRPFARAAEAVHVIPTVSPSDAILWTVSIIENRKLVQVAITAADVLAAKTVLESC